MGGAITWVTIIPAVAAATAMARTVEVTVEGRTAPALASTAATATRHEVDSRSVKGTSAVTEMTKMTEMRGIVGIVVVMGITVITLV